MNLGDTFQKKAIDLTTLESHPFPEAANTDAGILDHLRLTAELEEIEDESQSAKQKKWFFITRCISGI